jgi:hypothetical protein
MTFTRASYSFPAPGQVTAFGPTLVDGIVEEGLPPVMFAGEHTAYAFIGYMEGALSSGVRVGRMLLGTAARGATSQPAETQPAETQPADAAQVQPGEEQPAPNQPGEVQPTPPDQRAPAPERQGTPA